MSPGLPLVSVGSRQVQVWQSLGRHLFTCLIALCWIKALRGENWCMCFRSFLPKFAFNCSLVFDIPVKGFIYPSRCLKLWPCVGKKTPNPCFFSKPSFPHKTRVFGPKTEFYCQTRQFFRVWKHRVQECPFSFPNTTLTFPTFPLHSLLYGVCFFVSAFSKTFPQTATGNEWSFLQHKGGRRPEIDEGASLLGQKRRFASSEKTKRLKKIKENDKNQGVLQKVSFFVGSNLSTSKRIQRTPCCNPWNILEHSKSYH